MLINLRDDFEMIDTVKGRVKVGVRKYRDLFIIEFRGIEVCVGRSETRREKTVRRIRIELLRRV